MSTKEQVLKYLQDNKDKYVSGSFLSEELNVSRNAIWKAINSLKKEGIMIDAISNKGYKISNIVDVVNADTIMEYINDEDIRIEVFDSIESTNTYLKEKGMLGEKEGLLVVAKEQTKGKGRMNRAFSSPKNCGIYFSLLLRPEINPSEALFITTIAAVAVVGAIKKVTGKTAGIKWVNDVLLDNKKVCGILTEGSISMENGSLDYAVVGIGINVREPEGGYSEDIKDIAGPVVVSEEVENISSKLVAETVNEFMKHYRDLPEKNFLNDYKSNSIVIDKDIYIIDANHGSLGTTREVVEKYGDKLETAHVIDIDDSLGLVVKKSDGSIDTLRSGVVSFREVK